MRERRGRLPWLFLGTTSGSVAALRTQSSSSQAEPAGYCRPLGLCSGECQRPLETQARLWSLAESFHGPGLAAENLTHAVCVVPPDQGMVSVSHSPHAAQELYKCWSWWRLHPHATPVLVDASQQLITGRCDEYPRGLMRAFHALGVQIQWVVPPEQTAGAVLTSRHTGWPGQEEQWFLHQDHAREFRDALLSVGAHGQPSLSISDRYAAPRRPLPERPRIGLLQRRGTRKLHEQSEVALLEALEKVGSLDREAFEGKSYDSQVEFMSSHDIIVSPHGGQLTSIPFMPDCGGVVEIFPRFFFIPGFFGTLARNSGLEHFSIYPASEDVREALPAATDARFRHDARDVDSICAPTGEVARAVQEVQRRRLRCLAERAAK